jgi:hypothetical protein
MNVRPLKTLAAAAVFAALGTAALPAAADWSDTSISWRYGTAFHEPFDFNANGGAQNIKKNIFGLTHASGYKYGSNFFNVDMLQSDNKDPAGGGGASGAQEVYVVYRNTLDFGKISGKDFKWGWMRGLGGTFGFDWNTKNDGYASKKRMLVLGPTVMFDVPGFLNFSVLLFDESNSPAGVSRYHYQDHGALELDWGIPIGGSGFNVQGYWLIIDSKGRNEFGGPTATETHFDGAIMYDVGAAMGGPKATFKLGFEYEYWKNKFGNPSTGNPGATAKTPMIRAEYHF